MVVPGAEALRTWIVAIPGSADSLWWIQAVMRGPDLSALKAEVDAVARSLTFNEAPSPLDAADQRSAIAAAIDSVDRSMRAYPGRRFLACMPRAEGWVTTTIQDGPRGGSAARGDVYHAQFRPTTCGYGRPRWRSSGRRPPTKTPGSWARQVLFDGGGVVQETGSVAWDGRGHVVSWGRSQQGCA